MDASREHSICMLLRDFTITYTFALTHYQCLLYIHYMWLLIEGGNRTRTNSHGREQKSPENYATVTTPLFIFVSCVCIYV